MFKTFLKDEAGAITTDWVTLTSALIIAAIIIVYTLFSGGITPLTNTINEQIESGSTTTCESVGGSFAGASTECDDFVN